MRYIGQEDAEALLREAVRRAAEKYAEDAVDEADRYRCTRPGRRSVRRFQRQFHAYKKDGVKPALHAHRSSFFSGKKRGIAAVAGCCAAAVCLIGFFSAAGLWKESEYTEQSWDTAAAQVFQNVFIYENGQYYPFDENGRAVLSGDRAESTKRGIELPSGSIIGIEDSEIRSLTYRCENGIFFFSGEKASEEDTVKEDTATSSMEDSADSDAKRGSSGGGERQVTFSYYEGYCKDLEWSAGGGSFPGDSAAKSADASEVKEDVLTITAEMKDGTCRKMRILLNQDENGVLRAEIKEISEVSDETASK